ncbi:MAG: hypothetical protein JWN46_400 [Acidimicrobiales bacterium]|nr:hypothetical protein [Acidimicrobiales bacterium]
MSSITTKSLATKLAVAGGMAALAVGSLAGTANASIPAAFPGNSPVALNFFNQNLHLTTLHVQLSVRQSRVPEFGPLRALLGKNLPLVRSNIVCTKTDGTTYVSLPGGYKITKVQGADPTALAQIDVVVVGSPNVRACRLITNFGAHTLFGDASFVQKTDLFGVKRLGMTADLEVAS